MEHQLNVGNKIDLSGNGADFKFVSDQEVIIYMPNGGYVKIISDTKLECFCKPE